MEPGIDHEKCQCITLDEKGNIAGSCDSLFRTTELKSGRLKSKFPFLENIISYLSSVKDLAEPLFFPQVDFECDGYRSICDFTFMKTEDARGVKRFIWIIYDNSLHYHQLISAGCRLREFNPVLSR